jgi:hypothetical protein
MHDTIWNLFIYAVSVGFFAEMGCYFFFPRALAWAALLPVGTHRSFALPPAAREALTTDLVQPGGYREAPVRSLALTRASFPARLELPNAIARIYPERGFATVRPPYQLLSSRAALSVARIDIVERDGTIELRARFIPLMSISLVAGSLVGFVSALVLRGSFMIIGIGMLFVVLNLVLNYLFARAKITIAVDGVSAELASTLRNAGSQAG